MIFFPVQPGATFETFDEDRFLREVVDPVRELTKSDDSNPLALILFVIPCTMDTGKDTACEEVRFPKHNQEQLTTPTSWALRKHLARQYANGSIEYLNIPSWEGTEYSAREQAVSYARSRGDGIIICLPGSPFPTPDEVFRATRTLKGGGILEFIPDTVAL